MARRRLRLGGERRQLRPDLRLDGLGARDLRRRQGAVRFEVVDDGLDGRVDCAGDAGQCRIDRGDRRLERAERRPVLDICL